MARRKFLLRQLWVPALVLSLAALAIGVGRGEYAVVTQWAHTLCTSCIGLGR